MNFANFVVLENFAKTIFAKFAIFFSNSRNSRTFLPLRYPKNEEGLSVKHFRKKGGGRGEAKKEGSSYTIGNR